MAQSTTYRSSNKMHELRTVSLSGLLVLKRINYFNETRYKSLKRTPSVNLAHDELIARYRGIEGEPWPDALGREEITVHDGLAPLAEYRAVLEYFQNLKANMLCDLLYIRFVKTAVEELPRSNFSFCGYDYGFYSSVSNNYSVVFHEIIYGRYDELRACSKLLNQYLLIPTLEDIDKIENRRTQLVSEGADLETDESFEGFSPISIYALETTTPSRGGRP